MSSPFTIRKCTQGDWQARFVYTQRNDIRMEDYSCNDATHRDISGVKGVNEARAARAQAR